ncbi:Uncharacterized protein FWK35_00000660 [Aphis craccivora]|uniref:Reverse transcriptase domain-containing protein n=1 Tax=Aphis craccivora TaxID=307492 RepID=A0A6G0ZQV2_APHCR|nr:Uncharacterized protein FWK35_00000660 [Aphis craccivora]
MCVLELNGRLSTDKQNADNLFSSYFSSINTSEITSFVAYLHYVVFSPLVQTSLNKGASGFVEPPISWFNSFLLNRQHWVKVFGIKSNVFPSTPGVPQGGHLSPKVLK